MPTPLVVLPHGTHQDVTDAMLQPYQLMYDDDEEAIVVGSGIPGASKSIGVPSLAFNQQTGTNYTVQASDENKVIAMDNAAANTVTLNAGIMSGTVEFGIAQLGTGATTVVAGAGVTISSIGTLQVRGQFAMMGLVQMTQDNWLLVGNMN